MHISRIKLLCIEIFKTLNKLNPSFMQDILIVQSSSYSLREAIYNTIAQIKSLLAQIASDL